MYNSVFSNLPLGCVCLCFHNNKEKAEKQLSVIAQSVQKLLPAYKVELLETPKVFDGMLVARRFNLGVVQGGPAFLIAKVDADAVAVLAESFVQTLLDVQSLRNEEMLQVTPCGYHSLDSCIEPDFTDERQRKDTALWDGMFKGTVGKIFPNINYECSKVPERPISYELPDDLVEDDDCLVAAESFAPYRTSADSSDDNCLKERTELMKQISDLIKTYIVRYGTFNQDEIQRLMHGKITLRADRLSHLVLNRDCKLVLQDFDETELKLGGTINMAVYILFLLHPEGFFLKDIADYRTEIENIYTILSPRKAEEKVRDTLERIAQPGGDLNQCISKIKKHIKSTAPVGDVADHYVITGSRGGRYYIPIAQQEGMVTIMPKF